MLKTIDVSNLLGVSVSTIRYYEKIGIIPPIARDDRGYRIYDTITLNRIYLMKCLRDAGLSIQSMQEFSELSQGA
ncbi:MerR family transcriptional regulator [Vagococcus coleopterorum]|uniref:MerR family transcriptional regulator n=1 Tax=Vagococcus coleopterorum TaxID=2714946 RepID=UPI003B83589F